LKKIVKMSKLFLYKKKDWPYTLLQRGEKKMKAIKTWDGWQIGTYKVVFSMKYGFECWNNGKAFYAFQKKAEAFAFCRSMQEA